MADKKFLRFLLDNEESSIIDVMAFMSYNPSIGRVLEEGGVEKFQRLASKMVDELSDINSLISFDKFHDKFTRRIIYNFETSKGKYVSYGQAQKPINVFLKVYVDWAARPNKKIRRRLLPYLHVPLDSIVMDKVKKEFPSWYDKAINPYIKDSSQTHSLSKIDKGLYLRWQSFFRLMYPRKPLLFDVLWAIGR